VYSNNIFLPHLSSLVPSTLSIETLHLNLRHYSPSQQLFRLYTFSKMRYAPLALGILAFVGLTVSQAIYSPSYGMPIATSSSRLSHWRPSITALPRSMHTMAISRRNDVSLTLPLDRPCSSDSTTKLQQRQTDVCTYTQTPATPEMRGSCATSWYAYWVCVPAATSSTTNDFGVRTRRWVAQYASRSNDFGGRNQRVVARFAEPTVTAQPTPAVTGRPSYTTLPICSFNLSVGRYDCPQVASRSALPLCSFNVSARRYDCPTLKIAAATPIPRIPIPVQPCPSGGVGPFCSERASEAPDQTTMHIVRTA
jgi:hypothetical protein